MDICCCRWCTFIHHGTLITRVFSADSVTAHYHLMQQLYDKLQLVNTKTITGEEQLKGCVRAMNWPSNYYKLCYSLTINK